MSDLGQRMVFISDALKYKCTPLFGLKIFYWGWLWSDLSCLMAFSEEYHINLDNIRTRA